MKMKSTCVLAAVMLFGSVFAANTWYVDDDWYGKGGDGSAERPYGTIQDAVRADTTLAGDTILVAPGTYAHGSANAYGHNWRVYVSKADITIRATGGRDVTFIVGQAPDDPSTPYGAGAVAGVCAYGVDGFILDGFTVSDCHMLSDAIGSAVYGKSRAATHVFSCAFVRNYSKSGCVWQASVHRSRFQGNFVHSSDGNPASGVRNCDAEHCLFLANQLYAAYSADLYNCTILGNYRVCVDSPKRGLNLIVGKQTNSNTFYNWGSTPFCLSNSVTTATQGSTFSGLYVEGENAYEVNLDEVFVAPAFGDYGVLEGSPAALRGDPKHLTDWLALPQGRDPADDPGRYSTFRDYNGNPVDVTAERINAGAIQNVLVAKGQMGLVRFSGSDFAVDGRTVAPLFASFNWAYTIPTQWCLTATSPETAPLSCVKDSVLGRYRFAGFDGRIVVSTAAAGTEQTLAVEVADDIHYVNPDPLVGSDDYDGTSPTNVPGTLQGPWRTLVMAGTNKTYAASGRHVVYCAAGTYDSGSASQSRVLVSTSNIHFVGAGAGESIVVGKEADEEDPDYPGTGLGSGALRCVYAENPTAGFTGFTFTGGRTVTTVNWPVGYAAFAYCGTVGFTESVITGNYGRYYVACGDVTLERCLFSGNGAVGGGSYSKTPVLVDEITVDDAGGQLVREDAGGAMVFSASPDVARPISGVTVNGRVRLFDGSGRVVIPYSELVGGGTVTIAPYDSCTWYVNAGGAHGEWAAGDDANTGFSRLSPKLTLKEGASKAVAGDTVLAAAGTYDQGVVEFKRNWWATTLQSTNLLARVQIAANVTLRGEEGPEKTVIVGAPSPVATAANHGCGPGAIRCVYAGTGSTIEGFTLTDGHATDWSTSPAVSWGGAVLHADYNQNYRPALVSDCIISNCTSGTWMITADRLERCRVLDCATYSTLVTGESLSNVLFARNSATAEMFGGVTAVANMTWAADNTATYALFGSSCRVVNSIVEGKLGTPLAMTNCLYTSGTEPEAASGNRRLTAEEIALDGDYRPSISADSPALDAALEDEDTLARAGGTDAAGFQRVMNGRMDIGALEADWRGVYGTLLGHGVAVTEASPLVKALEETRQVKIPTGSSFVVTIADATERKFDVTVSGGTLVVKAGEMTIGTYTADAHIIFTPNGEPLTFTFVADPNAADACASIGRICRNTGIVLIVR